MANKKKDMPSSWVRTIRGKKKTNDYYAKLGEFVLAFAHIEDGLRLLLCHYAGVSQRRGKALFSGAKIDASMSFIKRLTKYHPEDVQDDLEFILNQLGQINSARNLILHYGIRFQTNGAHIASNSSIALTEVNLKEVPVSIEHLNWMIQDLMRMWAHMFWHLSRQSRSYSALVWSQYVDKSRRTAWLYKPPPQSASQKKRHGHSQKRQRPLQSSP